MPQNTPTTGIIRVLSELTETGSRLASLSQAHCAKANATSNVALFARHAHGTGGAGSRSRRPGNITLAIARLTSASAA